jgi:class 3 adenylate cyclase
MTIHALGPFRLDTEVGLLFRGAEPVMLGRRAIALLLALVERRGGLVSKDALIEATWPGQAVEESNLTVQISALRRVFSEEPGGDRWIESHFRRRYRFVGPVVTEAEKSVMAPREGAARDLAPSPHADPERRQITAMSCEPIGMSGRVDGVGLDELREVVRTFQRCVEETVERYDGFVVSRLGKIVIALFGYPAAHEHDAERAVRAGLELCAAIKTVRRGAEVPMRCRVGIATAMAIIGDLSGGVEREDPAIVGDAPGLAAQLRISAQPDMVAIERTTRHLIGNLFDSRDLGAIQTTGDTEPVHYWRVLTAPRRPPPRSQSPQKKSDRHARTFHRSRNARTAADCGYVVGLAPAAGEGNRRQAGVRRLPRVGAARSAALPKRTGRLLRAILCCQYRQAACAPDIRPTGDAVHDPPADGRGRPDRRL